MPPADAQPAAIILPAGARCLWAGAGATLAFNGKRVNYTCGAQGEDQLGVLGTPTQQAGLWQVEQATITHGQSGFTLKKSEAVAFLAATLDLADGTQCAFAGQGATFAFDGKRLNYTCGQEGADTLGLLGDLEASEKGIYLAAKAVMGKNDQGFTLKTIAHVPVAQINGAVANVVTGEGTNTMTSATTSTVTNTVTSTASTTRTTGLPAEMLNVVWQWQEPTVGDTSKYTIQFLPDGNLGLRADCNRGRGRYQLVGQRLLLQGIAMTLMACPGGTHDREFLQQVNAIDGYQMDGENLVLTTQVSPGKLLFAPAAPVGETKLSGSLTGTVTYRQRIALLPGSVISVQLQDVSKQDVAATVVTSQLITTTGENVPIPFQLTYDPTKIDPKSTYALSVRITTAGKLAWINTQRYAVLTGGAPVNAVDVIVQPAR